jgi:hypothetical protein
MPSRVCLLLLLCCLGCSTSAARYRPLPAPSRTETPSVNPSRDIRQKNWLGKNNEGSCVHASLSSMLHWQNQFELAKWWRSQYSGGEWSDELRRRLDAAKIPYAFTERANIQLLDDAHAQRRGALLWWKPSHCCTFCGWVKNSDGKVYAAILDNNYPDRYEFVERSQFHKAWAGYGGFALSTLFDPPSPPVWRSFQPIDWQW